MKIGKERVVVFLLTIGFLFCTLTPLQAIDFQWGMFMNLGTPTGAFRENIGKSLFGPGFATDFSIRLGRMPLRIGARLHLDTYGSDTRRESVFVPEFGDVSFDVHHRYGMTEADIFLRWQGFSGRFLQPYLEVTMGFTTMSGRASIPANYGDSEDDATLASRSLISNTKFAYGGGAGLLIRVARAVSEENRKIVTNHFISLGIDYTSTGSMEYMGKGSVVISEGAVTKVTFRSQVTYLTARLGYSIRF